MKHPAFVNSGRNPAMSYLGELRANMVRTGNAAKAVERTGECYPSLELKMARFFPEAMSLSAAEKIKFFEGMAAKSVSDPSLLANVENSMNRAIYYQRDPESYPVTPGFKLETLSNELVELAKARP